MWGLKTVFTGRIMFAICGATPSCINHCVCRGKPFAMNGGKKLFWSICKYHSEITVSFKKIGLSKLWLGFATHTVTCPLWLLFLWKFSGGPVPQNCMVHLLTVLSEWKQISSENCMLKRISWFPATQAGNWNYLSLTLSKSLFTAAILYGSIFKFF
jgi:hypothetical protein